jgi:hypothetical protein
MTAYCPTIGSLLGQGNWAEVGFSDAADRVRQRTAESLEHYLKPRLDQFVPEIKGVVIDANALGSTGIPVDQETVEMAVAFASLLPGFVAAPEISADPDGEISFDWIQASGKMFSVSVNKSGRLAYAGWFGENSRNHGIEKLVDSIPQEILRGLQRTTRR